MDIMNSLLNKPSNMWDFSWQSHLSTIKKRNIISIYKNRDFQEKSIFTQTKHLCTYKHEYTQFQGKRVLRQVYLPSYNNRWFQKLRLTLLINITR